MDTASPAQSIMAKMITIKDIELRTQARRKLLVAKQYFVQFSVGNTSRSTNSAKEAKNRTSWSEKIFFDGDDRSILLVQVYRKHCIGENKVVGSFTDTIGELLRKLKDGVLEHILRKDTSDGSDLPGITIRFALAAEPRGDVNADERQATDAVARATEGLNPLSSTSAAVGVLGSAVDTGENVVAGVVAKAQTFEDTWGVLLERIKLFNEIVGGIAQIHPYASLAWSVISAANQVLVSQKDRDERIIRLAGTMSDVFAFVKDAEPLKAIKAHINIITLLIQQVTECGYFITEYAKQKNFWIRTAKYAMTAIDSRIAGYENKFEELKTGFLEGVAVQTEITVVRMMNVVSDTAETVILDDMPYAFGARFQREKGCLPGTRESFLQEICDALNDPKEAAPRVCLLTGVAGSGKSAVAHSIARLYDGQQRLGSSYCFARTDVAKRNPQNLFSTIARDLSDHDPQYKTALWGVVKDDRALRTSQSAMEQVERLIIEPSRHLDPIGPLVVVIDALDESGDRDDRWDLLCAISEKIAENTLPTNLRFLITARPESDILDALHPDLQIVRKHMGDIPQGLVDGDLEKFIYHSLHHYTELEACWPNREWCRLLVGHSQHLFQWASTACKFIKGEGTIGLDPRERLDKLLQSANTDGGHSLDKLYCTVLSQLFTSDDTQERFRMVIAIVFALNEPLSLTSLSTLLGVNLNVRAIIKPMGSLLDGVHDEKKPIRPLHNSFRDFLLDKARSSVFHVVIQPQHSLRLGQALLACMRNMLRFNICDLKDSRVRNPAIPDLPAQVNKAIPPHLAYSCQYWMHHLQYLDCTADLLHDITLFFKTFFPYWLEVISLLSLFAPLSSILSALETCTILKKWAKDQEIAILASEASQFIQVFAPVLRESTPHLYLSAMPQTPSSSPLCKLWANKLQKDVAVTSGHLASWPAEIHTLQGHMDAVTSVAYSPDGIHIVSGSWDNTIRIWNGTTGQCVVGPLQGHSDNIYAVAYSPDGTHIISGSWDKTIRVWNATTGQPVAGPFMGHTNGVYSVAYSPDGTHIASGSADGTIRVWDAITGKCTAGPLKGHTDQVHSVTYSPSGTHIVSGSHDKTIMVWNAITGQCIAGPFEGHTDLVTSVAYSPDGKHIASGSQDKTIRIWSAITGQFAEQFQGHTDWVISVAYSPDGRHIVSGSKDKTIRAWDATTGQSVAGPFQGHTNAVWSVAYSLDGAHIISGSGDKAIKIWNATMGVSVPGPFQGHTNAVNSVVYSPDGAYITSGSWDKTIRVWNATTGHSVAGPFLGHTDEVYSVAYSPDSTHIISGSWDNTIRVWDVTTGQCVMGPVQGHTGQVMSVAYSPDGTHIISGSWDKTIMVWNAITGQALAGPLKEHINGVCSVAYSPNGTHIVSGSEDKTIRVWNATTGQCIAGPFEGHTHPVHSVAFSPSGIHIASGSQDKTIRIWNAITGQCVAGPFWGHTDKVNSIAYSPDGTYIISGSDDRTIRIWNATTGQCVAGPLQGHIDLIQSVAYSPDGNYVVTGSWDCSIKVWRVEGLASFGDFHEQDGWIYSSNVGCFGWIAPWNRHAFQLPIHSLVISSHPIYQVDISDRSFFGEAWTLCWN